jgi:peptidyl-prolyl cis-trans isomerase A (cyclophilin A)
MGSKRGRETGGRKKSEAPQPARSRAKPVWLIAAAVAALAVVAYQAQRGGSGALTNPGALKETAPAIYQAVFDTSAGTFVVKVDRSWAPFGADRFYNLVKNGFYDGCRFFRVVPTFMVQFGINGDPAVSSAWDGATIPDDRPRVSNTRGRVTFAKRAIPDSRTTQIFINFGDNSRLDRDGFAPFGEVVTSMVLVERIFSGYGEAPDQTRIESEGNTFLESFFPRLDYVKKATIE